MILISKDFKFEAAHHLRNYEGKCQFPHGHSYHGTIWVEGELNEIGFVMDYGDIKAITDYFDHKDLNELPEFKELNPTAEHIVDVVLEKLVQNCKHKKNIFNFAIKLHETENSSVFVATNKALNYLGI